MGERGGAGNEWRFVKGKKSGQFRIPDESLCIPDKNTLILAKLGTNYGTDITGVPPEIDPSNRLPIATKQTGDSILIKFPPPSTRLINYVIYVSREDRDRKGRNSVSDDDRSSKRQLGQS